MINPELTKILLTTFTYGVCGSLASAAIWFLSRGESVPRFDQSLGIGFLIGAAFGAFFAIFQSWMAPV
jgi:hypothetical protein